ncbi:L-threonine dehydratase catabolic TdcB-like [Lytechinus pictus]|uniref:L-threonine dehydratase catabolic TdcB-like n=1 Tax=Lytechinus pictus TaxID=7653 RepID=UPI0030B9B07A
MTAASVRASNIWATWNSISDDGLVGWVPSTVAAEGIREAFESETGMKFVTEWKTGPWRNPNGDDSDVDLVVVRKKSKSSKLKAKEENQTNGEEWEGAADEDLDETEDQTEPQKGGQEKVVPFKTRFTDTIWKETTVPNDGVPFFSISRFICSCIFGKDRHDRGKQRMRRHEQEQKRSEEEGTPLPKRRQRAATRKVCCPAMLAMKKVVRFPDFKVNEFTPKKCREMRETLRAKLLSGEEVRREIRVYMKLPTEADHAKHELVGEPKKKRKKLIKYNSNAPTATLEDIENAYKVVQNSALCKRTPMMLHAEVLLDLDVGCELGLKLENMQTTGSFKVRGLANQLAQIPQSINKEEVELVTMSAGNYGKAFAFALQDSGFKARVLMPDTAPANREEVMKSYGVEVERLPNDVLKPTIDHYVTEYGMHYLHPFDDFHLICGHGSVGLEILEDVPDPDVVLVCCGGGGLLAGIAAAVKLSGKSETRVYGVEPEQACLMYMSMQLNKVVINPSVQSVASGLAPPFAGYNAYRHAAKYVDDILLLSEAEIIASVTRLYHAGLVVEPAGAAAFGALLFGKVPDIEGKKVVAVITGSNVSPEELCNIIQTAS